MVTATMRCSGNSRDIGGAQGSARTTLSIAVIFMGRIIGRVPLAILLVVCLVYASREVPHEQPRPGPTRATGDPLGGRGRRPGARHAAAPSSAGAARHGREPRRDSHGADPG